MHNTSKSMIVVWSMAALIVLSIVYVVLSPSREKKLIKQGYVIINKIESFRSKNGRLPNSLNEIGIKETLEGPFFYEKLDSSNYILWFGTSLGESVTYYSQKKIWE